MVDAYKRLWTRAFDFQGRSTRGDYWWATLASTIIVLLLISLMAYTEIFVSIYTLYVFAGLIPNLSLSIRRVRDTGKGWQWILINLIPLIGGIWFIVILCQPSIPIA